LAVDARSIEYYRAFVMFRWLVSVAATLDRGGSGMDRSVHFGLVPVLAVRLPRALATLLGVTLPPVPDPAEATAGPATEVLDVLGADLTQVILPAVTSPEATRRGRAVLLYLSHLGALDRYGLELAEAELDDLAALLGARPASVELGHDALKVAVSSAAEPALEALSYFWWAGHRQVTLWPPVAARAFALPTTIPENLSTSGARA
jgi:hypothetical protein